jgi:hypothetical protein
MNAIVPATAEPAMLGFLQRVVVDPEFDSGKFEVVLRAIREERALAAQRAFDDAMAVAQGEMEPVRRDLTNPHTRSKYASYEAVDLMLRPVYSRHGFSVTYRTAPTEPGVIRLVCMVAGHGHNVESRVISRTRQCRQPG